MLDSSESAFSIEEHIAYPEREKKITTKKLCGELWVHALYTQHHTLAAAAAGAIYWEKTAAAVAVFYSMLATRAAFEAWDGRVQFFNLVLIPGEQ